MNYSNLTTYINDMVKNDKEFINYLQHDIDERVYSYGMQFSDPIEKHNKTRKKIVQKLRPFIGKQLILLRDLIKRIPKSSGKKKIVSDASHTFNTQMQEIGFEVYRPCFAPTFEQNTLTNKKIMFKVRSLIKKIKSYNLNQLLDLKFIQEMKHFKQILTDFYLKNNINALVSNCDTLFFHRLSIDIFKELSLPNFIFSHGYQGINYSTKVNNRSDYFIVWGEKSKQTFIEWGFDKKKIFVSGHPLYKEIPTHNLKFSMQNILIITKAMASDNYLNEHKLSDRGNSILYVKLIEQTLKKLGVKKAKLRPHPSENGYWYLQYLDNTFWSIDQDNLVNSLKKSTLVIGPASTVFIESLYYGVNYLIFDPVINKTDLLNCKLAPPFDGSDQRIPVAKNNIELIDIIKNENIVDLSCFGDYVKVPFDIRFLKELI